MPKVSIIIPVYNAGNYLPMCLDSICNQTCGDIEVICVDDGSTDKSLEILQQYQQKDGRIKILEQKNQGSGVARNKGIQVAKGDFIAFMDSDDWYPDNDILDVLYFTAKENNVHLCGGVYQIWDEKNHNGHSTKYKHHCAYPKYGLMESNNTQLANGYLSFIFEAKWLRDNNIYFPQYLRGQDMPFFAKAMYHAQSYYTINKATYCYRINHKTVKWDVKKINDYLLSIIDLLQLSREWRWEIQHVKKLKDFYGSSLLLIFKNKLYVNNLELPSIVSQINSSIDNNLLQANPLTKHIPTSILFRMPGFNTTFQRIRTFGKCSLLLFVLLCFEDGIANTVKRTLEYLYSK